MKILKVIFYVVGCGIFLYLFRDIWMGIIHHFPEFAKFGLGEWAIIAWFFFNIWLWKNYKKHPALTILWKNLRSAYIIIGIALGMIWVQNKFKNKK